MVTGDDNQDVIVFCRHFPHRGQRIIEGELFAQQRTDVIQMRGMVDARTFDLKFTDGRTFHVIASDGGYLHTPVGMTSLIIAPSERFEVLVDFSNGKAGILETAPDGNMMRGMSGGMMAGLGESVGGPLMSFEPHPTSAATASVLPQTLVPLAAVDPSRAIRRR